MLATTSAGPVRIDLGRCVFCDACTEVCPEHKLAFTPETLETFWKTMGVSIEGEGLVLGSGEEPAPTPAEPTPKRAKLVQ